jgi:hypothetical protein
MVHPDESSCITPLIDDDAAAIYGCQCSLALWTLAAEPGAQDAPKDVATVGAPSFLASVVVAVLAATDGGCSHSELESWIWCVYCLV